MITRIAALSAAIERNFSWRSQWRAIPWTTCGTLPPEAVDLTPGWLALNAISPHRGGAQAEIRRARIVAVAAPAVALALLGWHAGHGPPASPGDALIVSLPIALLAVPFLLRALRSAASGALLVAAWGGVGALGGMLRSGHPDGTLIGVLCALVLLTGLTTSAASGAAYAVALSAVALALGWPLGHPAEMALAVLPIVGVAALAHEVDRERRFWAAQAAEARARFELATGDGAEGVFDWRLDRDEIQYSPRFREVLGYDGFSRFPPLPQQLLSPDLVWPEDYERVRDELTAHLERGGPLDLECRLVTAEGNPRWVRLRGHTTRRPDGEPVRLTGSIRDVSGRREAEELAERFVQAASSQFRAPLTSIRGVHRLMTGGAFGELPQLATRMLGIAERNSAQLEDLVDQLLELRRLQRGTAALSLEVVEVDAILLEVAQRAGDHLAESGVRVLAEGGGAERAVRADRERLVRALVAMVVAGADQLTGPATVRLGVEPRADAVRLRLAREASSQDLGWQRDISRVLSHWPSAAEALDATSLGVSIAQALIESHGGLITLHRPSGGTLLVQIDLEPVTDASFRRDSAARRAAGP